MQGAMRTVAPGALRHGVRVWCAAHREGQAVGMAAVAAAGRRRLQVSTSNSSIVFDIKGEAVAGRSTFLDNQSTTAMDPRVLDKLL